MNIPFLTKKKPFVSPKKLRAGNKTLLHWHIILGATFLLGIGVVSFNMYTFFQIQEAMRNANPPAPEVVKNLDKEALQDIITTFETKEAARARIIQNTPFVEDPS